MRELTARHGAAALAGLLLAAGLGAADAAEDTKVIELTQTACQFLESEDGVERGFTTTKKADCDAINAATGAERVAAATVLELKPGNDSLCC